MFNNNSRILAISPHSDDIELGCGGTLRRAINEGAKVHPILVLAQDIVPLEETELVDSNQRIYEMSLAMNNLRITDTLDVMLQESYDFDLLQYPKNKVITKLDEYIEDYDINTVLLPVPSFHQEHQYVYDCAIAATRNTKQRKVATVLAYEYPAANWGESASFDSSKGGLYVNISKYMEDKLKAISCHKTQMYNKDNALISEEGVTTLARMRGLEMGVQYAELFHVMRMTI